jgi:hypothetical protein
MSIKLESGVIVKIPEDKIEVMQKLAAEVENAEYGIRLDNFLLKEASKKMWKTLREIMPEIMDNYEVSFNSAANSLTILYSKK